MCFRQLVVDHDLNYLAWQFFFLPISKSTLNYPPYRTVVQILADQIIARPIFYFLQHPEAPDLRSNRSRK